MRFPSETIPAPAPPVDAIEVGPKTAVGPVRRIGGGGRGVSAQVGGGQAAGEERPAFSEREGSDRRKLCRRIYHTPVMLNTRTGKDRRKDSRRPDDPLTNLDRKI